MAAQVIALAARLEHQRELVVLEVAQPAVDQLRRLAAGAAREVALLDQRDAEPAHGGVAGDAGAVDAAADHEQIERGRRQCLGERRRDAPSDTGLSPACARHRHRRPVVCITRGGEPPSAILPDQRDHEVGDVGAGRPGREEIAERGEARDRRRDGGARPRAGGRRGSPAPRSSPSAKAPAASVGPSMPSVPAARSAHPGRPASSIATAAASSWLRPPRPAPASRAHGGLAAGDHERGQRARGGAPDSAGSRRASRARGRRGLAGERTPRATRSSARRRVGPMPPRAARAVALPATRSGRTGPRRRRSRASVSRRRRRAPRARDGAARAAAAGRVGAGRAHDRERVGDRSSGSPTVGPEPTTARSSPGTSETTSAAAGRPTSRAASRPPLIADRCFRTAFIAGDVDAAREQPGARCAARPRA